MKKAFNIVKNIIVWLIVAIAVVMMVFTIVSVNTFDRTDRNIFGYRALIVLSDSMSATDFSAGDLILVKEVNPTTLQVGDIISFTSTDESNYGEVVTHKIRELTVDSEGNPGFITYGTTTDTDDETIVTYAYILGKYQFHLAGVGSFFRFLKTTPGYILRILLPFLVLIVIQIANSVSLFKKYKREQMEEIEEQKRAQEEELRLQKEELLAQQEESRRMMEELAELKKRLDM